MTAVVLDLENMKTLTVKMSEPTEEQVKELRNYVFESPTTDNNWGFCKEKWMKPDAFKWLEEQAEMIKARAAKNKYG